MRVCVCVYVYVCKRIRRVREDERASLPRYEPCTLMSVFLLIFSSIKSARRASLVALKLNDVSVFRILNDASVAVEPLFAFLENDLLVDLRIDSLRERSKIYKVERVSQSSRSAMTRRASLSLSRTCPCDCARDSAHAVAHLHSRPTLSSVALLHANVNVVVLHGIRRFFLLLFALYFVSKVERFVRKGIVRWSDIRTKRARRQSSSHHQSALSFVVESTSVALRARGSARTIHPSRLHPRLARVRHRARVERPIVLASVSRRRESSRDASRDETSRFETTRRGIDRVCRAIFERRRARDARRDGARDSDEETHQKRGRRPYMSTRSPRT